MRLGFFIAAGTGTTCAPTEKDRAIALARQLLAHDRTTISAEEARLLARHLLAALYLT